MFLSRKCIQQPYQKLLLLLMKPLWEKLDLKEKLYSVIFNLIVNSQTILKMMKLFQNAFSI